jgi:hypothetical protein
MSVGSSTEATRSKVVPAYPFGSQPGSNTLSAPQDRAWTMSKATSCKSRLARFAQNNASVQRHHMAL